VLFLGRNFDAMRLLDWLARRERERRIRELLDEGEGQQRRDG
jgi:hypothetical protein